MSDLRTLPAIRAEAERLARDFLGAADVAFRAAGWDTDLIHGGEDYAEDALRLFAAAHLDLLCDLTRPASRDAVARLVAEKVGLVRGATAPILLRIKGMDPSTIWSLSVRSDIDMDKSPSVTVDQRGFVEPGAFPDSPIATVVPGISAITDPAEALRLIALHVLRSPDV